MAYEKKHGDCVLFPNNRKKNEKEPDFRGKIFIDGKDYDLAFWNKEGKNGAFLSGRMGGESQNYEKKGFATNFQRPKPEPQKELDDDIPWN
jgi:uncharacterized protein (DUF736 family)